MTNSDAEKELEAFIDSYRRIFKYRQEFIPDHYVAVIKINDQYSIVEKESTTTIEGFNKELFIKLLVKEELVFQTASAYADVKDLRTGGCNMGCWATSTPDLHTYGCRKYVK